MISIEQWYDKAQAEINSETDGAQAVAWQLLLDAVHDIRARQEPAYSKALAWFIDSKSRRCMSLALVCDIINQPVSRVMKNIEREIRG